MTLIRKGESLYQHSLMLLDYDADGVVFNENSLNEYLTKDYLNELTKLSKEEFEIVKKSFILYWENLYVLRLENISKTNKNSIFLMGYKDELIEIKNLIKWTEENLIFKDDK